MAHVDWRLHELLADVTLLAEGGVLLVKYDGMPDHQQGWFLPHDRLGHLEHPDAAVQRVLHEQFSLAAPPIHLSRIESFKGNDGSWHLVFHYRAELSEIPRVTASGALAALEWFPLDRLPGRSEVAHHGWALDVLAAVLGERVAPAVVAAG
jgi:ADP-ribose pyrophosphatase YjhB (NUDIX family)